MADRAAPAALGFSMPAEWEPHATTWIGWPHNASDWPGKLAATQRGYGELVRKLAPGQTVRGLGRAGAQRRAVRLCPAQCAGRDVVLEGGSIDVNGRGTLLTTEECLLDREVQARNPGLSRADLEAALRDSLGVTNVLWLGKGIAGDDTHGH